VNNSIMKKSLTLIALGIIGAVAGYWNLKNAESITGSLRAQALYNQMEEAQREFALTENPTMKINSYYGGASAAAICGSVALIGRELYLLKRKKFNPNM